MALSDNFCVKRSASRLFGLEHPLSNGPRTYLLIVDNQRVDGKVKQRVLHRLGRLDELLASGQLDSLIQSLGLFSEKLSVLGAHARGDSVTTRSARIGPP